MKDVRIGGGGLVVASFAAVYLIWGSTYLAIRFAVETLPPYLMAGVRFLIAGGVMYAWIRWRHPERPKLVHWRSAAIIGGLLLLGGNGSVVWAEQYVSSSVTVLLITMVPVWLVLLNWVRRDGVMPGLFEVAGIGLGIGGVLLLVMGGDVGGGHPVHRAGALVLVLASLSWALGSIYSRQAPLPKSTLLATSMEMLAGGGLLVVTGIMFGEVSRVDFADFSLLSVLSLGYLIVFGSLIGFTAYMWLLQVSTPAKVSTYAFVNPVVAVVLGCTLGGEPFSWRVLAAATVIIGGVVLITLHRAKATKPPESRKAMEGRANRRHFRRRKGNAPLAAPGYVLERCGTDERRCGEAVGVCE